MKPTETSVGENNSSAPLFKNTAFGRLLTRRNLILAAVIVIVLDIVLTHYFFNSRNKALFRNRVAVAARDNAGSPMRLGDLTPFEWKQVEISRRENGGTRFWFTTYGSRTYVFDYILDYEPKEISVTVPPGTVCLPDDEFVLERDGAGIRMQMLSPDE